jgi:hypothetical protein
MMAGSELAKKERAAWEGDRPVPLYKTQPKSNENIPTKTETQP